MPPSVMTTVEVLLWTATLGGVGTLLLAVGFELIHSRARWAVEVSLYMLCSMLCVAVLSGWALHLVGNRLAVTMALAPGALTSLTVMVGTLGVRNWLGTKKRERFADVALQVSIAACLVCLALVLVFEPRSPSPHRLNDLRWNEPASWVTPLALTCAVLGQIIGCLASLRVATHGDRRAWEMFTYSLLCGGLTTALIFKQLFDLNIGLQTQAFFCLLYVLGMLIVIRAAWRRGRKFVHVARMLDANSGRDPITRLPMGAGMIKLMDPVFAASLSLNHRPVLLIVKVFNADDIVKDCGENGLNQVLLTTLARIRKIVSPADLVGRYYGACFAVQINGRVTPQYLRGLGLRLAASTRCPVVPHLAPTGFEDDEPIETDIGVGICWSDRVDDLTLALHEAEIAAVAARLLRSRAAVKLGPEMDVLPVEKALGQAARQASYLDSASAQVRGLPGKLLGERGAAGMVRRTWGRAMKGAVSRAMNSAMARTTGVASPGFAAQRTAPSKRGAPSQKPSSRGGIRTPLNPVSR